MGSERVGFRVQRKQCATCIYRPDSPVNLPALEAQCKDRYGFWQAHKNEFPAGQIAQRLDRVIFVDVDTLKEHKA